MISNFANFAGQSTGCEMCRCCIHFVKVGQYLSTQGQNVDIDKVDIDNVNIDNVDCVKTTIYGSYEFEKNKTNRSSSQCHKTFAFLNSNGLYSKASSVNPIKVRILILRLPKV